VRRAVPISTAAALLVAAAPLAAQQVTLRAGGIRATYADSLTGSAGTLGGEFSWGSSRARATLGSTFAQFTTGDWAMQGSSNVALRIAGGLGVYVDAAANTLNDGSWSGTATGGLFAALVRGPLALSAFASAGGLRRVDVSPDRLLVAAGRARVLWKRWSLEGALTASQAGDSALADGTLALDVTVRSLRMGAVAGTRVGDLTHKQWLQGRAELRLTPLVSFETAAGGYPRDLTGFVSGKYVWAGLRLAIGGAPGRLGTRRDAARAVTVEPLDGARVRLTVRAGEARSLAIAGEWNGWTPQPLESLGEGRWTVVLPLGPGAWRFTLVADEERWFVPDGVPRLPDDFGGNAGLLVIGG
jgi:hypothetical protein